MSQRFWLAFLSKQIGLSGNRDTPLYALFKALLAGSETSSGFRRRKTRSRPEEADTIMTPAEEDYGDELFTVLFTIGLHFKNLIFPKIIRNFNVFKRY